METDAGFGVLDQHHERRAATGERRVSVGFFPSTLLHLVSSCRLSRWTRCLEINSSFSEWKPDKSLSTAEEIYRFVWYDEMIFIPPEHLFNGFFIDFLLHQSQSPTCLDSFISAVRLKTPSVFNILIIICLKTQTDLKNSRSTWLRTVSRMKTV